MKEIKAYACDYCKKYSKSKSTMKSHERICFHNPVTKSCATCSHYGQEEHREKDTTQFRPICVKGERLFIKTENLKVTLKNNCEIWQKR